MSPAGRNGSPRGSTSSRTPASPRHCHHQGAAGRSSSVKSQRASSQCRLPSPRISNLSQPSQSQSAIAGHGTDNARASKFPGTTSRLNSGTAARFTSGACVDTWPKPAASTGARPTNTSH